MSGDDRLLQAFRELVRAEFPQLTYAGCWEYSVDDARMVNGVATFDGHPTASGVPLPPAVQWPIRPGVAGVSFLPAVGSLVLVTFANADPTRPVVVAFDAEPPSDESIDASGTIAVADALGPTIRSGDAVMLTGCMVPGSPPTPAPTPTFYGTLTWTLPIPPVTGFPIISRVKT